MPNVCIIHINLRTRSIVYVFRWNHFWITFLNHVLSSREKVYGDSTTKYKVQGIT